MMERECSYTSKVTSTDSSPGGENINSIICLQDCVIVVVKNQKCMIQLNVILCVGFRRTMESCTFVYNANNTLLFCGFEYAILKFM